MACGAVLKSGRLCGEPTQKDLTTNQGHRLEFCARHWRQSESGAPVQVQVQCRNGCGVDASPDYAEKQWKGGVCGFCQAIEARPELAEVLRQ